MDLSDAKLVFDQTFHALPVWRAGLAPLPSEAPPSLAEPDFRWTAGYRNVIPARSEELAASHPAWSTLKDELEVYPNGDLIALLGDGPFRIDRGSLAIAARPISSKEAATLPPGTRAEYLSGALISYPFSQKYGYFEARVKLPRGRGLWPAFWMLSAHGGWPPENDIFEVLGNDTSALHISTHSKISGVTTHLVRSPDLSVAFHTIGCDWGPGILTYYEDGRRILSIPAPPDFDSAFYILLNLGVGNARSWPGAPDGSTRFPAIMQIEYVRAWQRARYAAPDGETPGQSTAQ